MPMSWEQNSSIVVWNGTGITTQIDAEPCFLKKCLHVPRNTCKAFIDKGSRGCAVRMKVPLCHHLAITRSKTPISARVLAVHREKRSALSPKRSPFSRKCWAFFCVYACLAHESGCLAIRRSWVVAPWWQSGSNGEPFHLRKRRCTGRSGPVRGMWKQFYEKKYFAKTHHHPFPLYKGIPKDLGRDVRSF
jgi:hypothetical protein